MLKVETTVIDLYNFWIISSPLSGPFIVNLWGEVSKGRGDNDKHSDGCQPGNVQKKNNFLWNLFPNFVAGESAFFGRWECFFWQMRVFFFGRWECWPNCQRRFCTSMGVWYRCNCLYGGRWRKMHGGSAYFWEPLCLLPILKKFPTQNWVVEAISSVNPFVFVFAQLWPDKYDIGQHFFTHPTKNLNCNVNVNVFKNASICTSCTI